MENINYILSEVKNNKKYKTISDEVVLAEINSYLKYHKISSVTKQDIKDIRKRLHKLYSSYQTKKKNKRDFYLEELKKAIENNKDISDITKKLLSITLSTKERLNDYDYIYENIFNITNKPKIIVDIGCGLNPLSFPLMNLSSLNYYAYDIDDNDIIFLNNYFNVMKAKINGKAEILDIRNSDKIIDLPKSDVIFIFKLLDLIDNKETNKNELVKSILAKTKFLVVSFATATLTGKKMKLKSRTGFEEFLKRNNLTYHSFQTSNEIFYVINK